MAKKPDSRSNSQLRLDGDLTQINEQVHNERHDESSMRVRLATHGSNEELTPQQPNKKQTRKEVAHGIPNDNSQEMFLISPDKS